LSWTLSFSPHEPKGAPVLQSHQLGRKEKRDTLLNAEKKGHIEDIKERKKGWGNRCSEQLGKGQGTAHLRLRVRGNSKGGNKGRCPLSGGLGKQISYPMKGVLSYMVWRKRSWE